MMMVARGGWDWAACLKRAWVGTAMIWVAWVQAATLQSTPINAIPPNVSTEGYAPMMMLAASRDHTLFAPMYTDYEDLDSDLPGGSEGIDATYLPTFVYYGYFDPAKCYAYEAPRFVPKSLATKTAVTVANVTRSKYVCAQQWSGNFLNWATMTRLDVLRKMLYGGARDVDTHAETVLVQAQVTNDAHAFAKYYAGADVAEVTPFTVTDLSKNGSFVGLTLCTMATGKNVDTSVPALRLVRGNYSLWATLQGDACRFRTGTAAQALLAEDQRFGAKVLAYVREANSHVAADKVMPEHETVLPSESADGLHTLIGADAYYGATLKIKVCVDGLVGDERCQAYRYTENNVLKTALKPIGLLQKYGAALSATQAAKSEFGLITGSYDSNLLSGVVRKNMGALHDEIGTDGRFTYADGVSGNRCLKGRKGIIQSFDCIRLYKADNNYDIVSRNWVLPSEMLNGYYPSWGNPMGQMIVEAISYYAGLSPTVNQSRLNGLGTTIDASELGLAAPAWVDPLKDDTVVSGNVTRRDLYGRSICRPMNVVALSSSALSFDHDASGYANLDAQMALMGAGSVNSYTDAVGDNELISGTLRAVGSVDGTFGSECTAKTVGRLSSVTGLCPEAPAVKGGFKSAGAAYFANTHAIRAKSSIPGYTSTSAALPANMPAHALRVRTYAASLAGGVARIDVKVGGSTVYITPESLWNIGRTSNTPLSGAMLTLKTIQDTGTRGDFIVTWNDAQFGMDYDMDMVGYLGYEVVNDAGKKQIRIKTDILNYSAGFAGAHGFSITGGISGGGRVLTHGGRGFQQGPADVRHACAYRAGKTTAEDKQYISLNCNYTNEGMPTSVNLAAYDGWAYPSRFKDAAGINRDVGFASGMLPSYVVTTFDVDASNNASVLKDPLWYAAKYGSFSTGETAYAASSNSKPAAGDAANGYASARNPAALEAKLERMFGEILAKSNTSPTVSTSQLQVGSYKYVAEFNRDALSGTVKAYQILADGSFSSSPSFSAGNKLYEQPESQRQVISNVGQTGLAFNAATLNADTNGAFKDYWTALAAGTWTDVQNAKFVSYLRGSATDENATSETSKLFRARRDSGDSIMGPVVNAAPWVQRQTSANLSDALLPSSWSKYSSYLLSKVSLNPPKVLWVASDDGMLHAFRAESSSRTSGDMGAPLLSYIPGPVVGNLAAFYEPTHTQLMALVDGSPYTADVHLRGQAAVSGSEKWATYLFGSLGRGGKAIYALDVSDPVGTFSERHAASVFRWQFTSDDDTDLGYVMTDPVTHLQSRQASSVVMLNNGRFAVLQPNGYQSSRGRAALFMLYVDGPSGTPTSGVTWTLGTDYAKLVASANDSGNGLMGATWVDVDNNGTADWVYATDLKGQVWKFDVTDPDPVNWKVAYQSGDTNLPLFTALAADGQTPLPLTTAPVVSFPRMGGVLLGFGTGKAIESADFPNTVLAHRFYAIWDRGDYNTVTRSLPTLSSLVARTFARAADGTVSLMLAAASNSSSSTSDDVTDPTAIDYSSANGWYASFPAGGVGDVYGSSEMLVFTPFYAAGSVFFNTVWVPVGASSGGCGAAIKSTFYALDPLKGTASGVLGSGVVGLSTLDQKIVLSADSTAFGDTTVTDNTNPSSPSPATTVVPKCESVTEQKASALGGQERLAVCVPSSKARIQWREIRGLRTQ